MFTVQGGEEKVDLLAVWFNLRGFKASNQCGETGAAFPRPLQDKVLIAFVRGAMDTGDLASGEETEPRNLQ